MAIDFLIFGLLLISFAINLLALGAFWVTPGLRTTANRFVINLLVVNLIGCMILAPTLFLSTYKKIKAEDILEIKIKDRLSFRDNDKEDHRIYGINFDRINSTITTETLLKCNNSRCEKVTIENDRDSETIVITEMEVNSDRDIGDENSNNLNEDNSQNIRCWSLDVAAALGALSVLLVVGDTWCAVTDPLRYHSRISGPKAWILITITWFLGIFFGALSAVRGSTFKTAEDHGDHGKTAVINDSFEQNFANETEDQLKSVAMAPNDLYNIIFSCTYFIVIILLPFGFVCGMYWRIFSEARENGLRVRQNGSSPLLQSALNLSGPSSSHHNQNNVQQHQQLARDVIQTSGLTLKIDRRNSDKTDKDVRRPLLLPIPVHQPARRSSSSDNKPIVNKDRNQNILLTLSTANEEIRRNYSAKELPLLGASEEDFSENRKGGIRQVHSSPNLQKDGENSSVANIAHPGNALRLPNIQASPKALSYMTSIRHRLSNASSLFKYREESRAARISILVVIMFLVSYLPYGLLVLLQGRLANNFTNSTQIAIFMVLLGNLSSPFIFAYRNKRVRRGVKRLFGLDPRSREHRLNRSIGLLRAGTKASINVKRSASKASTYSVNSCKFLTPHVVKNGTFLMEIEKCHYVKAGCAKSAIVEQTFKDQEKRSILKIVCDSSRKLGCATNSCATSDNEQTDV